MKKIILNNGIECLVDDEDFGNLSKWKWSYDRGYARRGERKNGKHNKIYMHRFLMVCPDGHEVDHIDGNKQNNQKSNLRIVTRSQNNMNRKSERKSSSKYKGVSWSMDRKKWFASIRVNGKEMPLGRYDVEEDAARAYNAAALKHFGDYARINEV